MNGHYLRPGLPAPRAARDGLDAPFWSGLTEERLLLQRCRTCRRWQWGPEWLCHRCHAFELDYEPVAARGRLYSYERVWHPVHSALADQGPYIVALVELPHADDVRIVGNLLGDPTAEVRIGSDVRGVFEHHRDAQPAFTLLHWQVE